MSIQTELSRIINAKEAIKAAIEGKGVTVPESTLIDGMAPLIAYIQTGGGNEVTFNGKPVIGGTFVLTTDVTGSTSLLETRGMFEANKAYTVFMFAVGVHSNLLDSVGKKGIYGSVSKRFNVNNNNNASASGVYDNYGGLSAQKDFGLKKPYTNDYLTLYAGSNAIGKAGVEYGWIAVEDGV